MSFPMMSHFPRFSAKHGIALLFVLHLIPVWAFTFVPTQDGISHIYNAYILKEYNHPEYTRYREVYERNIKPFPNWAAHAFFLVALYVVPPLIAEKLFVTLCVVAVPLSLFYFLKQVDKRLMLFGLLGFLYSYHHLLHLGFYGFSLSFPLALLTLGYWWKHRAQLTLRSAVLFNLLVFATYFAHLFAFAVLLLSVSVLSLVCAGLPDESGRSLRQRTRNIIQTMLALMPGYLVFLAVLLLNPETKEKQYRSLGQLWEYFVSVRCLVSFNHRAVPLMWVLLVFLGGCVLWTLLTDKVRGRTRLGQRDGFLLLFGILVVLYFKIPWQVGPPAWLNDRAHLFLFPVLLAWFSFAWPTWLKCGLMAMMVAFSLVHLGMTFYDYRLLNKDMKEFTSGAHLITPNSTISILAGSYLETEYHGTLDEISPFYHDTAYYCLGNGSLYIGNYEPKYSYFPLRYREGYWKFEYPGEIDYMLVWRKDAEDEEVTHLREDYELIHQTQNLKLFRLRKDGESED